MKASDPHNEGGSALETVSLAGAGLLAALSATCCVIPVGAMILGLGGAWLSVLGPLVEWRGPILAASGLMLAWAAVRWRRRRGARSALRTALLAGVGLLWLGALAAPLWEGAATATLFRIWRDMP